MLNNFFWRPNLLMLLSKQSRKHNNFTIYLGAEKNEVYWFGAVGFLVFG